MPFYLRVLMFGIVLITGIYIGIHMAEGNMQQMQGTEGAPKAIHITPQKDGKIEISILGQVVETKKPTDVYEKQVNQLKDQMINETNYWSDLGNFIGNQVRESARGLLQWIFAWIS